MLKALDARIDQLLEECERIDQREEGLGSSVVVNQELAQAGGLKRKIKDAIEGFKDSGRKKINLTDPDCALMHSVQGSHASYNVQRSEEHTSELQSLRHLVCRLLLEKKKKTK